MITHRHDRTTSRRDPRQAVVGEEDEVDALEDVESVAPSRSFPSEPVAEEEREPRLPFFIIFLWASFLLDFFLPWC